MLNETYRKAEGVSQSMFKDFEKLSLQQFYRKWITKEEKTEDESKFLFGSLVDQLAFDMEGIDKEFVIANCQLPSDTIRKIVTKVYGSSDKFERLENADSLITRIASELNYGQGWKPETIINKVVTAGEEFYQFLKKASGKSVISQEDYNHAWDCVQVLRNHPATAEYFNKGQFGVELMFQLEIESKYTFNDLESIQTKGCIDILRVDNISQTIQLVDLKTTRSVREFMKSIKDYGYGYQMSFYTTLVRDWMKTFDGGNLSNYKIIPPFNVVIERYSRAPHIFEYSEADINALKSGDYIRGLKGWHDTLYELSWHINNNEWSYLREMKEKGKIKVII